MKGALVVQSWMEEASLDSIEEEWEFNPEISGAESS